MVTECIADVTRRNDHTKHHREPGHDALLAEGSASWLEPRLHIEKRHCEYLRSHERSHGVDRSRRLPALDGEQHDVDCAHRLGVVSRLHWQYHEIAIGAARGQGSLREVAGD